MSKIDDLIKELCPNGVVYKNLGSFCDIKTGAGVTKKDIVENGKYKIISGGILPMGMCDKTNRKGNTVTIARAGTAGFVNFIEDDFYLNDKCFSIIPKEENLIENKYLYYSLSNIQNRIYELKSSGTVPTVNTEKVSKIVVPIPPIEIQEEIVKILDKFGELESELESELEARKSQYEFWRGKLLNQKNEIKKLSDVSDVIDSLHATPQYVENGYPMIRVADVKGGIVNTTDALRVDAETYNKFISKYKPQKGDIIISRVGSFGNVCIVGDEDICLGQNTSVIHPKIDDKYLYYYLSSDNVQDWIKNNVNGAGYKSLSLANINEIPIAVPSIEEQKRVANILDKFDKLVNDITVGLPAEIELRRKQYEYYRNKLLSFEELSVSE